MGSEDHDRSELALGAFGELEKFANNIQGQTVASIRKVQDLTIHLATASVGIVGVLGPVLLSIGAGNATILLVAMVGFVLVIVSAFWGVRRSLRYEIRGFQWLANDLIPAQLEAIRKFRETQDEDGTLVQALDAKMDEWSARPEIGDSFHTFAFWAFVVSMFLLGASLVPWELLEGVDFPRLWIAAPIVETLPAAWIINSLGLLLDVVGVVLIFWYGIAAMVETGGKEVVTDGIDENALAMEAKYKRWSRVGLGLLVTGFILQLLSNFAPIQ